MDVDERKERKSGRDGGEEAVVGMGGIKDGCGR